MRTIKIENVFRETLFEYRARDNSFMKTLMKAIEKGVNLECAMTGIMGNCDENLCQMEIPKIVKITIKCADVMIKQLKEEKQ